MRLDGARRPADVNPRTVGLFLDRTELSFEELLSRAKTEPGRFRHTLVAFATEPEAQGRRWSNIRKKFAGVKSLLRFHKIEFSNFPKPKRTDGASIADERVPTQEEHGSKDGSSLSVEPDRFQAALDEVLDRVGPSPGLGVGGSLVLFDPVHQLG